jgi:hypothetical protein
LLALEKMKTSDPSRSKKLPKKNGILLVTVAFGVKGEVLRYLAFSLNPAPKNKFDHLESAVDLTAAFVYTTMEHCYKFHSKKTRATRITHSASAIPLD